ncbi:MAG: hypothetical protein ACI4VQ_07215 [Clostridia bacterium]
MVIMEVVGIVFGAIFAAVCFAFAINLAHTKQTYAAAIATLLTIILVASIFGCASSVH